MSLRIFVIENLNEFISVKWASHCNYFSKLNEKMFYVALKDVHEKGLRFQISLFTLSCNLSTKIYFVSAAAGSRCMIWEFFPMWFFVFIMQSRAHTQSFVVAFILFLTKNTTTITYNSFLPSSLTQGCNWESCFA